MSPAGRGKAAPVPDDVESPCAQDSPPSSAPELPQGKSGGPFPSPRGTRAPPGSLLGPTAELSHPEHFGAGGAAASGVPVPLRIPISPQAPIPSNLFYSLCYSKITPSPQFPHSPPLPPALSFGSLQSSAGSHFLSIPLTISLIPQDPFPPRHPHPPVAPASRFPRRCPFSRIPRVPAGVPLPHHRAMLPEG